MLDRKKLTEGHELGTNCHREYNKVEDFDHLEVRVGPTGDEDGADVEQEGFSQVDECTGEAMGTPFNKGTANASGEGFVSSQVEVGAEDAFEGHAANPTNVRKGLYRQ